MKKCIMFILTGLISSSALCAATEVKIERIEDAQLCFSNLAPGSTDQLKIDGDFYLVDSLTSTSAQKYLKDHVAPANAGNCVPVVVTGYRVKEKGHFPNPMAAFKVFKVLDISSG